MNLPEYFEFSCMSKTCSGRKGLDHLPSDLTSLNAKKPLIITDTDISKSGLIKKIINGFKASGFTLGVYDGVSSKSDINTIKELVSIYEDGGFDSIIAAGSGIIVDIAKIVNIAVSNKSSDLTTCTGLNKIKRPLNPFVLTTVSSGTGKEASCEASFEDLFYSSRYIMPNIVVTDPEMIGKENPELVIDTAMSALTIAMEAWASPENNPLRRPYANTCIELIMENLESVIENSVTEKNKLMEFVADFKDRKGRVALASASSMGGFIYSNSNEGPASLMGKAVSKITGIKEGLCMGMLLPYCLEFQALKSSSDLGGIFMPVAGINTFCGTPKGQRFSSAMGRLRGMVNKFFLITSGKIPRTLGDTGFTKDKIKEVAAVAAGVKGIEISVKDAEIILQHAFEGEPLVNK